MTKTDNNEPWVSLNGCNACINSVFCKELGNCAVLAIDARHPVYNKSKMKIVDKVRTIATGPDTKRMVDDLLGRGIPTMSDIMKSHTLEELEEMWEKGFDDDFKSSFNKLTKRKPEPVVRTWDGKVRLTKIEQMFIDNLNQKR